MAEKLNMTLVSNDDHALIGTFPRVSNFSLGTQSASPQKQLTGLSNQVLQSPALFSIEDVSRGVYSKFNTPQSK